MSPWSLSSLVATNAQLGNRRMKVVALVGLLLAAVGMHAASAAVFLNGHSLIRRRFPTYLAKVGDWWQFLANREARLAGMSHHSDPLLGVTVTRVAETRHSWATIGMTFSQWILAPNGLRLLLVSLVPLADEVQLFVDDTRVANVTVEQRRRFGKKFFVVRYTLRRRTIAMLPANCTLSFRVGNDDSPDALKLSALRIGVPGGSGELDRRPFPAIDKKGYPSSPVSSLNDELGRVIDLYRDAKNVFRAEFGKDLFLVYGTLLGPIREQRFLPWDDDFDVAYFSELQTVETVFDEAATIMEALVRAGFSVGLNKRGRPFRLGGLSGLREVRLDVRPIWSMGGFVWAPKHARLPLEPKDFVPCRSVEVGGQVFSVPAEPELFLRTYYGASWREPKPGHREPATLSKADRAVFQRLNFSPQAIIELNRRLAVGSSPVGQILSPGLVPLYPLEQRGKQTGL